MGQVSNAMQKIVSIPIRLYQLLLSPLLKPCCRYYPSCSQYTLSAIQQHGAVKGLWLGCCRILRCHPWAAGGYDPVLPEKKEKF